MNLRRAKQAGWLLGLLPVALFALGPEETEPYLRPGTFVDSDHPAIVARAGELTSRAGSEEEKIQALYEFVRDSYSLVDLSTFKASEVLSGGGNSCRQRSILLAALARAAGFPARLELQKVTLRNWHAGSGHRVDYTFAHGIAAIFVSGSWRRYETVGNQAKWRVWTQDPGRDGEMPLPFIPGKDCLFSPGRGIEIEAMPEHFADRTPELAALIEATDRIVPRPERQEN